MHASRVAGRKQLAVTGVLPLLFFVSDVGVTASVTRCKSAKQRSPSCTRVNVAKTPPDFPRATRTCTAPTHQPTTRLYTVSYDTRPAVRHRRQPRITSKRTRGCCTRNRAVADRTSTAISAQHPRYASTWSIQRNVDSSASRSTLSSDIPRYALTGERLVGPPFSDKKTRTTPHTNLNPTISHTEPPKA